MNFLLMIALNLLQPEATNYGWINYDPLVEPGGWTIRATNPNDRAV